MATEVTPQTPAPRRHRALRRGGRILRTVAASLGLWLIAGASAAADLSREEMRELEELLASLGFDPGPVDGIADSRTAVAIEGYQSFAALRVDGVPSQALLEELRGVTESLGKADQSAPAEVPPEVPPPTAADMAAPDDEGSRTSEAGDPGAPRSAQPFGDEPAGPAVHLASFRQETKAQEEWRRLQRLLPNLLSDMVPSVQAIDLGEEGLFFRLYARPFPNQATAEDFCLMLGAEGFSCRVANLESRQVAATGPVAEDVSDASSGEDPQAQPQAGPAVEQEVQRPDPVAPTAEESGEFDPLDAAQPPPTPEETAAAAPLVPTEAPATDEELTAPEPIPDSAGDGSPPVEVAIEPRPAPGPAVGAPIVLVTAEKIDRPAPSRVGMETAVGGRSGSAVGAPTILIVGARFSEGAAGEPEAPAADPAGRSGIGAKTDDPSLGETAMPGEEARPEATSEPTPTVEGQTAALVETGSEAYASATAAFEAGDCVTALRDYTVAFETGGLSRRLLAAGHNNRGRCHYEQGRYQEALDDFDRAIALDRTFAAAYYNRGRLHNAMGDGSRARDDLDAAYGLGFGRLDVEP